MEISLTTPALLFPAVSLLLIAYTNRYLAIARLIRDLKTKYEKEKRPADLRQIRFLKIRERSIRNMQSFAIASLFFATFSMAVIFFGQMRLAGFIFGASLIMMIVSLGIALRDIRLAGGALAIELQEMEEELDKEEK